MIYIILLLEIFLFGLVFFRLMTTNHWTLGKKLLVGLVAAILTECSGFIVAMILSLDPIALIFIKIPKVMASGLMVCFFYKNEIDH
jgi:hypothetical protein